MSNSSISNSSASNIPVQGVNSGNAAGSATNVPPGILALPNGTLLKGKVAELKPGHHAILQTPKGGILIKTDLPLQRGNEVVLRLDTSSSGIRARIISVDGNSPGEVGRNVTLTNPSIDSALLPTSTSAKTESLTTPVDVRLTSALPLRAILISPDASYDKLAERLNSFIIPRNVTTDGGGNFIVKLLPQTVRTMAPSAGNAQAVISALDTANSATPNVGDSASSSKISPSPGGAPAGTKPTGYYSQSPQATTPPTASLAEGQLAAKVIGTEQSGQALVRTIMGTLKIDLPQLSGGRNVILSPGTELTIQLLPANPNHFSNNSVAISASNAAGLLELSHHWHGIHQLFDTIQNINPAMAEQLSQNVIPTAGSKLASTILFFISALRGGDLAEWLGRSTLNKLEQAGHSKFINRLNREFHTLHKAYSEPPSQNWQAIFIPVQHDNGWHQLRMFIKQESKEQQKGSSGNRFIVELDLSQYGNVQLDGFIKNTTPKKRFDLIVRSTESFPNTQQNEIQSLFHNMVDFTGLHGNISFQHSQNFPNHPMEEIIANHQNVVV